MNTHHILTFCWYNGCTTNLFSELQMQPVCLFTKPFNMQRNSLPKQISFYVHKSIQRIPHFVYSHFASNPVSTKPYMRLL